MTALYRDGSCDSKSRVYIVRLALQGRSLPFFRKAHRKDDVGVPGCM